MGFKWATLIVEDMTKSLDFYMNIVGLKVERRFSPMAGVEIAFLSDGISSTQLELMTHARKEEIVHSNYISIGFTCSDLEAKIAQLKTGGYEVDETIYSPQPQVKFFYATDPDGLKVQFILE